MGMIPTVEMEGPGGRVKVNHDEVAHWKRQGYTLCTHQERTAAERAGDDAYQRAIEGGIPKEEAYKVAQNAFNEEKKKEAAETAAKPNDDAAWQAHRDRAGPQTGNTGNSRGQTSEGDSQSGGAAITGKAVGAATSDEDEG